MLKQAGAKIYSKIQRFGPSLMLVIALIPIAGILLGFGTMMQDATFQGYMPFLANPVVVSISNMLKSCGSLVFGNLALLFAISIAIGLTDNDGVAGAGAAIGYLIMNQTMGSLLGVTPEIAATEYSRYTTMLGIPTLQTGVFGGIVIGLITAWVYKRFSHLEFPPAFAFFQGKRFVPIACALAGVLIGILFIFIWPPIQSGLNYVSTSMIDSNKPFAAFSYGFLGRLLIPFGLHHAWYPSFYYEFGQYTSLAGDLIRGDVNIFFAQLADGVKITAGTFTSGQFILSGTCTAAALAMIHEARPENKKKVAGMLAGGILTVILTGITEPIEFAFLFVAFPLFVLHSLITGLGFMVMVLLDVHVGTTFAGGMFDYLLYGILPRTPGWVLVIPVTIAFGVVYYFIFRYLIRKFNFKTPGREADFQISETKKSSAGQFAFDVLSNLGGKENITMLDACATRLRVTLINKSVVDRDKFKEMGASGILEIGDNMQIIFGPKSSRLKDQIRDIMDGKVVQEDLKEEVVEVTMLEDIVSPMNGTIMPLDAVPDSVFSGKMMGEGFAIEPVDGTVVSPVNGKIMTVFPTKHAIGILSDGGMEVLVHIGIDSVKLNGEGFTMLVEDGQIIEAGQSLMSYDKDLIEKQIPSMISPVVFTNIPNKKVILKKTNTVKAGEKDIIAFAEKEV